MIFSKKSQMSVGQIFTYLIAIFVVAFVLLMGYRAIASLREKGQEADYLQFKSRLAAAVKLTKGYGDATQESFSVPGNYQEVCFVDSSLLSSSPITCSVCGPPIIKNSVESGVKKNVFLVKNNQEIDSFFIDEIAVDLAPAAGDTDETPDIDNFGCIPLTEGKLKIKFIGQGDRTLISTFT